MPQNFQPHISAQPPFEVLRILGATVFAHNPLAVQDIPAEGACIARVIGDMSSLNMLIHVTLYI